MRNTNWFTWLFFALFIFNACTYSTQKVKEENTSTPSFKTETALQGCFSLNSGVQKFSVSAVKGGTIKTSDGSIILVAPGTFTDLNGNPVEGEVAISYKAMNTPAEIVASGIPMVASFGGKTGSFVSDGMFDIQANTAAGGKVNIASGKSIEVYTPARDKESDFKYWYFDNKAGNWIDIGDRNSLSSNKDIELSKEQMGLPNAVAFYDYISRPEFKFSSLEETEKPLQSIPGKYDPKKQILDIKFDKNLYPEFAPFSKILWQFAGTDVKTDPANNSWIYQSAWQDVKLTPKNDGSNTYNLAIKTGGKVFITTVKPVVNGKDAEKADEMAKALTKRIECDSDMKKGGASEATLERNMYNSFRVNRLGTYNCDRFYSNSSASDFDATFELNGENLSPDKQIYFLSDNKTSVLCYNARNYKFRIDPKVVDAVFVVAAQGAIAAVSKGDVANLRKQNGGRIKLLFNKVGKTISNLTDLSETINNL